MTEASVTPMPQAQSAVAITPWRAGGVNNGSGSIDSSYSIGMALLAIRALLAGWWDGMMEASVIHTLQAQPTVQLWAFDSSADWRETIIQVATASQVSTTLQMMLADQMA